jgi:hypothetical protein
MAAAAAAAVRTRCLRAGAAAPEASAAAHDAEDEDEDEDEEATEGLVCLRAAVFSALAVTAVLRCQYPYVCTSKQVLLYQ